MRSQDPIRFCLTYNGIITSVEIFNFNGNDYPDSYFSVGRVGQNSNNFYCILNNTEYRERFILLKRLIIRRCRKNVPLKHHSILELPAKHIYF